jgi:hypothetical protein
MRQVVVDHVNALISLVVSDIIKYPSVSPVAVHALGAGRRKAERKLAADVETEARLPPTNASLHEDYH